MSEVVTPCVLADVEFKVDEGGADMQIKPAMVRHIEMGLRLPQRDDLRHLSGASVGNIP